MSIITTNTNDGRITYTILQNGEVKILYTQAIADTLKNLITTDFKDLKNLTTNFDFSGLTEQQCFQKFFELPYKDIPFFDMLMDDLENFYKTYGNSDPFSGEIPFPYNTIEDTTNIRDNFYHLFSPLYKIQKKLTKIISCLANTPGNNVEKIAELSKLNKNKSTFLKTDLAFITPNDDIFDFTPRKVNIHFKKYSWDYKNQLLFCNNKINFTTYYSNVEDLAFYLLQELFKSPIRIGYCPQCKHYFTAENQHQIYCSAQCKIEHYNNNENEFQKIYRKYYKRVCSCFTTGKNKMSTDETKYEAINKLVKIRNQYKDKDFTDETKVEYIKKLESIKY